MIDNLSSLCLKIIKIKYLINYMNKDVCILIFGMRRSGLHCITNDIQVNFSNNHKEKINFLNDVIVRRFVRKKHKKNCIFLFEDKLIQYQTKIDLQYKVLIIRDIYDNIISRIKKGKGWCRIDDLFLSTTKKILKLFLENNVEYVLINYDKYISDNNYRSNILQNKFGLTKITKFGTEIPLYGGGKTFQIGEKREDVIVSKRIFNLIKNDLEFLDLTTRYFGYDLIDKLSLHLKK